MTKEPDKNVLVQKVSCIKIIMSNLMRKHTKEKIQKKKYKIFALNILICI